MARVREVAPPLMEDRPLHGDIESVAGAIRAGQLSDGEAEG